jgi:hypothetical protein
MTLTPKGWSKFQHYKDRSPAWIKLHKHLLDDFAFQRLPVASRALAPMLWLLASEYEEGRITATAEEVAFRLRMSEQEYSSALNPLIQAGFFECYQDASEVLAQPERKASLEKRREEIEKEVEKKGDPPKEGGKPPKPPEWEPPGWIPSEAWGQFVGMRKAKGKRAPFTDAARDGIVRELRGLMDQGHDPGEVLRQSVINGWSGVFPLKPRPHAQGKQGALEARNRAVAEAWMPPELREQEGVR